MSDWYMFIPHIVGVSFAIFFVLFAKYQKDKNDKK